MVVTGTQSWVISLVLMFIQTNQSAEGVTRTWFREVHQVGSGLSRRRWREENWGPWPALQETPCWIKPPSKSSAASAFPGECSGKWLLSRSRALFSLERQNRGALEGEKNCEIRNDVGLRQENDSLAAVDQILWQWWWALSTEPICTDSASLKCKYHPHWGL